MKNKNRFFEWVKDNKWLLIILVLAFILSSWPSFVFNLPITQTDGATYFYNAKLYKETKSFDTEIPKFNQIAAVENKVGDSPPFLIWTLASFFRFFDDIFVMNGFYGAVFFVLMNLTLYFFVKDLTKNKITSLIVLLFSLVNVRAYYTLFTGSMPGFISFTLVIITLYFTNKFFENKRLTNLLILLILTIITAFTYIGNAIFLVLLQLALIIGKLIQENIKISNNIKINFSMEKINLKKLKSVLFFFIISFLSLGYVLLKHTLTTPGRTGYFSELIASLLQTRTGGYFNFWYFPFILEGPLFVFFTLIGIFLLLKKENIKLLSLFLTGLFIVVLPGLILTKNVWLNMYFHRFYIVFFVIAAIVAGKFITALISIKRLKILGISLLILSLIYQLIIVSFFFSKVGPALSQAEYNAAIYLNEQNNKNIQYVDTIPRTANFRDLKWAIVLSEPEEFSITSKIDTNLDPNYIFISDISKEIEAPHNYKIIFSEDNTVILKKEPIQ